MSVETFIPQMIYAPTETGDAVPAVMVAPPRYVQGPGVIQNVGRYLSILNIQRVAVLASARGHASQAGQVIESLQKHQMHGVPVVFAGECSLAEINAAVDGLRDEGVQCLITVGGGKCVDAGKSVAHRLGVPVVVVPTLASNDAPCSAVSVLYTPDGIADGAEFFPQNPVFVVVDSEVVAQASERYLVSGMGDAMATWYEAKVCLQNKAARNVLGGRPTLASVAMGETCASTLYEHGVAAGQAVCGCQVDDALEKVIEANTLLSGVGFESGGLAGAHGLAQGYTTLAEVERNYLHGEMVAMGVLTQLMMEADHAEARRVAEFFVSVGLPVNLAQLGLQAGERAKLESVAAGAMLFAPIHNLPFEVNQDTVLQAILAADALGRDVQSKLGDDAYRRVQS